MRKNICTFEKKAVLLRRKSLNNRIMEAVIYRTAEEKRSARRRLLAIKEAVEEQMRQRMEKMEW